MPSKMDRNNPECQVYTKEKKKMIHMSIFTACPTPYPPCGRGQGENRLDEEKRSPDTPQECLTSVHKLRRAMSSDGLTTMRVSARSCKTNC